MESGNISGMLVEKYLGKVQEIIARTDLGRLYGSCNGRDKAYAQGILLKLHQEFEKVYGEGPVDSRMNSVMMPAVLRGRKTGKMALGFVLLDMESQGEHWGTVFLTDREIINAMGSVSPEQGTYIKENFVPYDYWYTPLAEHDCHVDYSSMPEDAMELWKCVGELRASGGIQTQSMGGIK